MLNPRPGMKANDWTRRPIWCAATAASPNETTMTIQTRRPERDRDLLGSRGEPNPEDSPDCRPVHERSFPPDPDPEAVVGEEPEEEHRPDEVRDRRADRGPADAEGGEAEVPKDERVVDREVQNVLDDSDLEWGLRVARRAEGRVRDEDHEEERDGEKEDPDIIGRQVADVLRRRERRDDVLREEDPDEEEWDREQRARDEALEQEVVCLPGLLRTGGSGDERDRPCGDPDHHGEREEHEVSADSNGSGFRDADAADHYEIDRRCEDLEKVRDDDGPREVQNCPPEAPRFAREETHAAANSATAINITLRRRAKRARCFSSLPL